MDFLLNSGLECKPVNICRCCLKNECFKEICTEYYCSGEKEVYEEMLKNTFNVQISHQVGGRQSCKRLICENCITRLRDATTFKQMVIHSEERFDEHLKTLQYSNCTDIKRSESELNVEPIKMEPSPVLDDFEVKCDQNDDSFDDDEILANIKLEITRADGGTILDPAVTKRKHSRERRSKLKRCKIKETKGLANHQSTQKDWSKITERRGNGPLLRENSLKLLANSTVCVFQWNKSRYRCFCCKEPFSDIATLRDHTNTRHTLENIEKKIILQQNRLVKVEVSHLYCKLCHEKLEDLVNLKEHLSRLHNIRFDSEDLLVPFRIEEELKCQLCFENFTVFRLLNMHMNKHYQKQVCHICGAGFSNLVFLNLHRTRSHRLLHCKDCDVTFTNKVDKKHHDANTHGVKYERKLRFPCPYCEQRFFQENFRVEHLVEKHGMPKPEYKCTVCSKTFITRSLCNNHTKNVHMKEKNNECDVCHHLFYTKSDVRRHRVTHTGEKKYFCSLCNIPFTTKDSMRRHVKRTHGGVN